MTGEELTIVILAGIVVFFILFWGGNRRFVKRTSGFSMENRRYISKFGHSDHSRKWDKKEKDDEQRR